MGAAPSVDAGALQHMSTATGAGVGTAAPVQAEVVDLATAHVICSRFGVAMLPVADGVLTRLKAPPYFQEIGRLSSGLVWSGNSAHCHGT